MSIPSRFRPAIFALILVSFVGIALAVGLRKTVSLNLNGESRTLTTYAFTVGSLLRSLNIPLSPQDDLSPPQDAWLKRGAQVVLVRAVPVQVLAGGSLVNFYSPDRSPNGLLAQAGTDLLPDDLLLTNGRPVDPGQAFPAGTASISLEIIRSVEFTLTLNGQVIDLSSSAPTLGSALWSAGFPLLVSDALAPQANTPLSPGLSTTLHPSHQVTVRTSLEDATIRTAATTVGEALQDAGLSLQGLDYSLPPPADPIPPSGLVQLVRVSEEVLIEQTPLAFETQFQPVDDLEIDNQSIVQAGEYGLTATRVRVRYEDGQEVSRQVDSQWVARQPQPRIIGYGTQLVMHTTTVDGVQIQYWRAVNMYATSYHPSEVGGTTASGLPLQKGVAAIDRRYVAFGTQLYIPGYGQAVAADTGGGVIGRWIDLGYSDDDYVPWHQFVTIYFLWPPPANVVWIIP